MGEVYLAEDTKLGREVAIKVLPEELTGDTERMARFEREAHVLASLNHSNIAGIYEIDETDGVHFLAMELAEGEDLADLLTRGPMPVEDAIEISRQLAEALEAAHEVGVVHRDLKPDNINVATGGATGIAVKVLDFGLAKALDRSSESSPDLTASPTLTAQMTQAGVILGTAAYMSPEQARVSRRTSGPTSGLSASFCGRCSPASVSSWAIRSPTPSRPCCETISRTNRCPPLFPGAYGAYSLVASIATQ